MRRRRSCAGAWVFRGLLLVALLTGGPAWGQTLTIDGPAGLLEGTLERATGPQAALILPGSGPTDRDGNQPATGLNTDAYRLLAEALAAQGLSVLRVDKRGIGGSGGDGNAVSLAEYRADTAAWIAALRAETGADCVWLIGHSEGGLVALFSADLPDICGLVLLSTPGTALGPILVRQIADHPLYGAHSQAVARVVEDISVGLAPDLTELPEPLALIFRPQTLGYLTELIATDPAELARGIDRPILALTGDADAQIPADAADPLVASNPDIQSAILRGMTHMLKQVPPGDFAAGAQSYTDPAMPLHDGLVPTLLDFIAAHTR